VIKEADRKLLTGASQGDIVRWLREEGDTTTQGVDGS
jgi:hypothetical protein